MKQATSIMKYIVALLMFISLTNCSSRVPAQNSSTVNNLADAAVLTVPLGGNSWASLTTKTGGTVTNNGIENWSDGKQTFTTYIRLSKTGILKLWLEGKVPEGKSEVLVTIKEKQATLKLEGAEPNAFYAGEWNIKDTGYIAISISGIKKTGPVFAAIANLKITGTTINEQTTFVKNNEGNFFYWGRRGPSVHLSYAVPQNITAEWFYNEVTVPAGNDVVGSYYMANGFAEGYFGMQVNSATERRILFSVWSPFITDDPKQIPEDEKIKLLKKGEDVHAGEFGNEGSGGQSYLRYNWRAGTTYAFLLHGLPDGKDYTTYTAYFYAPETSKWMLIASFKRPKTNTYLKRFHSFLENFIPEQGNIERAVLFNNQWVKDTSGQWMEINKARFTYDNTAAKGHRKDYAGGLMQNQFFLRNCGFFNNYTPLNSSFERPLTGLKPEINFKKLP